MSYRPNVNYFPSYFWNPVSSVVVDLWRTLVLPFAWECWVAVMFTLSLPNRGVTRAESQIWRWQKQYAANLESTRIRTECSVFCGWFPDEAVLATCYQSWRPERGRGLIRINSCPSWCRGHCCCFATPARVINSKSDLIRQLWCIPRRPSWPASLCQIQTVLRKSADTGSSLWDYPKRKFSCPSVSCADYDVLLPFLFESFFFFFYVS